ncbi:GNAT family N-acetyltransferase [bacterium]|nr:GNAT family N-acetyltransferase [bacterium]
MKKSIIQNIIEFQKEAAIISLADYGENHTLNWVYNQSNHWPHSIIGTTERFNFDSILKRISKKEYPPFWIMDQQQSVDQIAFLDHNGFKEINRWQGMSLLKDNFKESDSVDGSIELFNVTTNSDLNEWLSVVKPVMMENKNFSDKVLNYWLENTNYVLMIGKENHKCISAGMAYINNDVAGLYFIATLPESQGKGYASELVEELIKQCFKNEVKEIVLHSSNMGRKLYAKMNFMTYGSISTYWKLGMF